MSLNNPSAGGGISIPSLQQFRLTTQTGTPVTTADRAAQSTLYLTPATGNLISLITGGLFSTLVLAEASLALTGLAANTIYDVFAYLNASNALAIELSAAWSGNTPTDAIVNVNGVPVKNADNTRRWVGTIRASAATTVEDTKQKRWVWNAYNQAPRSCGKALTTDNHTYNSTTWREWNNGTNGPHRFSFINSVSQSFPVNGYVELGPGTAGNLAYSCLSLNVVAESPVSVSCAAGALSRCGLSGSFDSIIGFNELILVEAAGATSTYNQYVIGSVIQA